MGNKFYLATVDSGYGLEEYIAQLDFFEKYKKHYSGEAIAFFKEAINKELAFTGNDHYDRIAGYLLHLKKLISKDELDHIVYKLKSEYKRKSWGLVTMITLIAECHI